MLKARLVEEIVALLHEIEGATVERNVRLPTLSDPSQIREIDVLVSASVAGHIVRIPIECKNYSSRISAGLIDEFAGKVTDVGLSVRNSIYVSVEGFGRDARRRANDHGIKLFQLNGLTPDRLSSAIHQAFQSAVYYLLRIEEVRFESERNHDEIWSVMWLKDKLGNYRGGLFDLVWEKWVAGEIPLEWGTHHLKIDPPPGWTWHINDPAKPRNVSVGYRILGLVVTATAQAHRHTLDDILEQRLDREHIRAIFRDTPDAIRLTVVENDAELQAATRPGGVVDIVFSSERAPRIQVLGKMYWPPTEKAIAVTQQKIDDIRSSPNPDWDRLQDLTFEELEGTNIAAIWGKTWSGHPSSRGEDWPRRYESASSKERIRDRKSRIHVKPRQRRRSSEG